MRKSYPITWVLAILSLLAFQPATSATCQEDYMYSSETERLLGTVKPPSNCTLTTKAYSFGGTNDDSFTDATIDSNGQVYACGNTYSPQYTTGDQDIVVFQFDTTASLKYGRYWGATKSEYATGITLDTAETNFFVSGYSDSIGQLSTSSYDMFIVKFVAATGLVSWARRYGYDGNDLANGIAYYNGFIYLAGQSDSTGWTSSKTDMVFIQVAETTGLAQWAYSLGGSQDDLGLIARVDSSDNTLYMLGNGYSVEITQGSLDVFLVHMGNDGTLQYFYNFGGTNPDYAMDLRVFSNTLYITGHSLSSTLSNGFLDVYVLSTSKTNPS